MRKISLYLTSLLVFISCGPHGLIGTLPKVDDPEKAAEIYIIRTSSISAKVMGFKVSLDGIPILGIGDGEYTKFRVKPKEHTIKVTTKKGLADRENKFTVFCEEKGKYYLKISPGYYAANIEQITAEEAEQIIRESKFLDIEK